MSRRSLWRGALLLVAAAGAATIGLLWDQLPAVRLGGVASLRTTPLLPAIWSPVMAKRPLRIICQGDSLTYGSLGWNPLRRWFARGAGDRVTTPYPETLGRRLGSGVAVVNRGFPADTVAMGARRWPLAQRGDLVLLMYGTNDADPRGRRAAVPLARYRAEMETLIRAHQQHGASVIVLAPPPAGTLRAEAAILPYRVMSLAAARSTGARFVDPAAFLTNQALPMQWDGLHLQAGAEAAIGEGLARLIGPVRS